MSANWYDDHRNLATLARWMVEEGDDTAAVIYMLEKPWKYSGEWECMVRAASWPGRLHRESARAADRLALVPPHARALPSGFTVACQSIDPRVTCTVSCERYRSGEGECAPVRHA